MNNKIRKLRYVKLDQSILRLMIFIDVFFVNNKDLSSQIEYVICLVDDIYVNILHWTSIKCKRVIRNVLVVELYAMIYDFDVDSVLKATLTKMFDVLISFILVTDSKSLYDCLVKLNIIVKKRLMMNVMILRQSYERREITEVKWISENHNSVDALIKLKASKTLKEVIDIHHIKLNIVEWIERINQINEKKKTRLDETNWKKESNESNQSVSQIKSVLWFSEMLQCWYNYIICS
jgi:hypothetical protein